MYCRSKIICLDGTIEGGRLSKGCFIPTTRNSTNVKVLCCGGWDEYELEYEYEYELENYLILLLQVQYYREEQANKYIKAMMQVKITALSMHEDLSKPPRTANQTK